MDEEIVIDRGQPTVMKLDADEQALMDEIQISAPRSSLYPDPARPSQDLKCYPLKKRWMHLSTPTNRLHQVNPLRKRKLIMVREPISMTMNPMGPGSVSGRTTFQGVYFN